MSHVWMFSSAIVKTWWFLSQQSSLGSLWFLSVSDLQQSRGRYEDLPKKWLAGWCWYVEQALGMIILLIIGNIDGYWSNLFTTLYGMFWTIMECRYREHLSRSKRFALNDVPSIYLTVCYENPPFSMEKSSTTGRFCHSYCWDYRG